MISMDLSMNMYITNIYIYIYIYTHTSTQCYPETVQTIDTNSIYIYDYMIYIYTYIHILTLLHTYSCTICIEKVPKANLTQICFSHPQDHIIAKVGGQSRRSTSE